MTWRHTVDRRYADPLLARIVQIAATATPARLSRDSQRTIQFFRLYTRAEEAVAIDQLLPATICAEVAALSDQERFMDNGDGTEVVCWPAEPYADNRLVLEKFRVTDLPTTRTRQGERGIIPIQEDQGLGEATHVLFFENNVVGVDFNASGPHPTRLRDYLQNRFPNTYRSLAMRAIIDRDTQGRVRAIEHVTGLEVQMSSHTLDALRGDPGNYLDVLKSAQAVAGDDAGVVAMRWATNKREVYLDTENAHAFVLHVLENRGDFGRNTKLILVGNTADGKTERLNLLSDKVVSRQRVVKLPGSRTIDPADAFRAIGEAYNKLRDRFPAQAFIAE